MRAYELMVIYDGESDEAVVNANLAGIASQVEAGGGRIATTDRWGRRRFAYQIADNGPLAVARTKRAVHLAAEVDLATANSFEQEVFGSCFATQDQKEGMKAFLEKRKANFRGK